MEIIEKIDNEKVILSVDKEIYCHNAVLAATYKFTNYCYIHIATHTSADSDFYKISFTNKVLNMDLLSIVNQFCNELIDQQLRYNLAQTNNPIKALIIKKAFFPFEEYEQRNQ